MKIRNICKEASLRHDYVWIDSYCIDKSDPKEVSEAINTMFHWYSESAICYAYISDYNCRRRSETLDLGKAGWFRRGWTLQELIAPTEIHFLDAEWTFLGTRSSLSNELSAITGIDREILQATDQEQIKTLLRKTTVARKMSWAASRETSRIEDLAYCMLGLFEVNMALLYGERANALIRLQEEIMKNSNDLTLFGWQAAPSSTERASATTISPTAFAHWIRNDLADSSEMTIHCRGVLATHPREFIHAARLTNFYDTQANPEFSLSNKGLRIIMQLRALPEYHQNLFYMPLLCYRRNSHDSAELEHTGPVGIYLRRLGDYGNMYARFSPETLGVDLDNPVGQNHGEQLIYVRKDTDWAVTVVRPVVETEVKPEVQVFGKLQKVAEID